MKRAKTIKSLNLQFGLELHNKLTSPVAKEWDSSLKVSQSGIKPAMSRVSDNSLLTNCDK